MVTLVGTEILRGRDLIEPVTAEDWLHFNVALLLHDIGFVRGARRAARGAPMVPARSSSTRKAAV